jgi:hypothetical protein
VDALVCGSGHDEERPLSAELRRAEIAWRWAGDGKSPGRVLILMRRLARNLGR